MNLLHNTNLYRYPPNSSLAIRMQKTPNQGSGNPQESQRLQAEIQALKQRLQETGARGDNELEQWRKVVEQEKNRADQAEKAANEMHKHVQVHKTYTSMQECTPKYMINTQNIVFLCR